jgi:hypothetical protein
MKPIGLVFKDYQVNPFTGKGSGELMLVHICLNCESISSNRIAGDDSVEEITILLGTDLEQRQLNKLTSMGIKLLTPKDKDKVLVSLFGFK